MGFNCWKTEQWNAFAGIRQDMFKIIDVLAITSDSTLGVQSGTWKGRHAHLGKLCLKQATESANWVSNKARRKLWLISWRKVLRKPGGKAVKWIPYIDVINPDLSVTALNQQDLPSQFVCEDED